MLPVYRYIMFYAPLHKNFRFPHPQKCLSLKTVGFLKCARETQHGHPYVANFLNELVPVYGTGGKESNCQNIDFSLKIYWFFEMILLSDLSYFLISIGTKKS